MLSPKRAPDVIARSPHILHAAFRVMRVLRRKEPACQCTPPHTGRNACCCRCQYGSLMLFWGVYILSMQLCGPEEQKPGSRNRSNRDTFWCLRQNGPLKTSFGPHVLDMQLPEPLRVCGGTAPCLPVHCTQIHTHRRTHIHTHTHTHRQGSSCRALSWVGPAEGLSNTGDRWAVSTAAAARRLLSGRGAQGATAAAVVMLLSHVGCPAGGRRGHRGLQPPHRGARDR